MKTISLSKIFTILLVLYPIISVYDSPVGPFCLADTLLLIMYPILFTYMLNKQIMKLDTLQISLTIFVTVNIAVVTFLSISDIDEILRNQGHFIFVLLTLAVFAPNFFLKDFGTKLLCYTSFISSLYLILQVVLLHGFEIVLKAHLPFLTAHISVNGHIRPFAFLGEPAAFGSFVAIGLSTVLILRPFSDKTNRMMEMVMSLAMLLSLSSTAIALLIIAWGYYIVLIHRKNFLKIKLSTLLAVTTVVILFICANRRMNILSFIYAHIVPTDGASMAAGVSGRLGNISLMDTAYSFGMMESWFGRGMVDLTMFLPAFARAYLYFGVIGCIVLGVYFIKLFRRSGNYGRLLIILVMANAVFADSIFGLAMFGYMQYVMMYQKPYREGLPVCNSMVQGKTVHEIESTAMQMERQ